ncbi:SDR family oxidoreductase [Candidatus Saccharibacteria bacterium]|nr:SDR family oxidoreductase [Candidatus Saccharibacteria bacterium]
MIYFITGASDRLGCELAKLLLEDGEKVVGLSRTKPDYEVDFLKLDLTNEDSIREAANEIAKTDGEISLVNCAGVMARETENNFAEISRVFLTNTMGPILLENLLFDKIRVEGGEFVNIISTSATRGDIRQPIYSSSKWGLRGFTLGLSERLKGSRARAISFVPGGFLSRMAEKIDKQIADPENWAPVADVAKMLYEVLKTPRTVEISEIVVNRKYEIKEEQ